MSTKSENMTVKQALIVMGIAVPAGIFRAWMLTILWVWFFVEPFGLPQISIPLMMALSLTVSVFNPASYLQGSKDAEHGDFAKALGRVIGLSVLFPATSVGIGWIIKMFI